MVATGVCKDSLLSDAKEIVTISPIVALLLAIELFEETIRVLIVGITESKRTLEPDVIAVTLVAVFPALSAIPEIEKATFPCESPASIVLMAV